MLHDANKSEVRQSVLCPFPSSFKNGEQQGCSPFPYSMQKL